MSDVSLTLLLGPELRTGRLAAILHTYHLRMSEGRCMLEVYDFCMACRKCCKAENIVEQFNLQDLVMMINAILCCTIMA